MLRKECEHWQEVEPDKVIQDLKSDLADAKKREAVFKHPTVAGTNMHWICIDVSKSKEERLYLANKLLGFPPASLRT